MGYWRNLGSSIIGRSQTRVSPYKEAGASGTAVYGGFVENIERDPRLAGAERYRTAADVVANVSIVAAGLRYFLNLARAPKWKIEPAKDLNNGEDSSDAAKQAAEFFEEVLGDMATSWPRIVRRSAMYRFHGFGIQEWTAKRREDGLVGIEDVEPRPQHTIELWERDDSGKILGVHQRSPQTSDLLWLPRSKIMYLVDDSLTDSPEGMGWFRHLVDPADRIRKYLKLEGQGFERDMRGIPIGRAPLADLRKLLQDQVITPAEYELMLRGIRQFVRAQSKGEDTGLLLDSTTFTGTTADGTTVSPVQKWGMELLTGGAMGFDEIGKSIERVCRDMAMILGAEGLLLGGAGGSANRSLAEDKSKNLYINVNGTLDDMAEATTKDLITPVWRLNGLDDALRPSVKVEDVAFKDAEAIAATLRDMAQAGAVLAPDDPAIQDMRDLLGISRQPEMTPEQVALWSGAKSGVDPNAPPAEAPAKPGQTPAKGKPPAKGKA